MSTSLLSNQILAASSRVAELVSKESTRPSRSPADVGPDPSCNSKHRKKDNDTVSHKCIICGIGFRQRKPVLLYPNVTNKKLNRSCKILDEFSIFFTLEECFNVPTEETEVIFTDLVDSFGEPGHWGVSLCTKHSKVVEEGKEIHHLMKLLKNKLRDLKKALQDDALASFEIDAGCDFQDQCKGYKKIRAAVKKVKAETDDILPSSFSNPIEEIVVSDDEDVQEIVVSDDEDLEEHIDTKIDNVWEDDMEVKVEIFDDPMITPDSPDPEVKIELDNLDLDSNVIYSNEDIEDEDVDLSSDNNSIDYNTKKKAKKRKSVKPRSLQRLEKSTRAQKLVGKAKGAKEQPVYKCLYCPLKFGNADARNAHRSSAHAEAKKPFECNICGNGFLSRHTLKYHQGKVHGSERPFPCDQCPKAYAFAVDLRKHQKLAHSSMALEKVKCPTCLKEFKGQFNLNNHIRDYHRAEKGLGPKVKKTFSCKLCSNTYTNSQSLLRHQAKEHNLTSYEPSVCDECGKQLSDSQSLRKHKQSQHLKTFKYTCEICGSKSLFKSHLDAHMKSAHSSETVGSLNKTKRKAKSSKTSILEKPHEISNAQQFLDSSYPHECYSCGEEFDSRSELQSHKSNCAQFAFL